MTSVYHHADNKCFILHINPGAKIGHYYHVLRTTAGIDTITGSDELCTAELVSGVNVDVPQAELQRAADDCVVKPAEKSKVKDV